MTAADTFDAQPAAFEDAVFEHGLHHVLAARWGITAGRRRERRDENPVEIDGKKENFSNESFPLLIVDC